MRKTTLLLSLVVFALCGCKQGEQPKKGAGEAAKQEAPAEQGKAEGAVAPTEAAPAEPAQPATAQEGKGEPKAAEVADAQAAVKAMAGAAPEATGEPARGPSPAELQAKEAARRNFQVDMERLLVTFVELWCAKQRGASERELYDAYKRLDYPPLDMWEYSFMAAASSEQWCADAMNKVREKCAPPAESLTPPMGKPAAEAGEKALAPAAAPAAGPGAAAGATAPAATAAPVPTPASAAAPAGAN